MTDPSAQVVQWASAVLGCGEPVLRPLGPGGPWVIEEAGRARAVLVEGDPDDEDVQRRFATQAAALEVAAAHGVPAPRLLAADLSPASLALLMTFLPGSSAVPHEASRARLRALGEGVAPIHRIQAPTSAALPPRAAPLEDLDFPIAPPSRETEVLLSEARDAVRSRRAPDEPHVLVHGDLWQGNTMWEGDRYIAALDWDHAGVGPAGIDVGSLRCDAALFFGEGAADVVLDGWWRAAGAPEVDVVWWDIVAALSTPPDVAAWLPTLHVQGRTDLDAATVNTRRDAFLAAALRASG